MAVVPTGGIGAENRTADCGEGDPGRRGLGGRWDRAQRRCCSCLRVRWTSRSCRPKGYAHQKWHVTTTVPALVGGRYRPDWEIEDQ